MDRYTVSRKRLLPFFFTLVVAWSGMITSPLSASESMSGGAIQAAREAVGRARAAAAQAHVSETIIRTQTPGLRLQQVQAANQAAAAQVDVALDALQRAVLTPIATAQAVVATAQAAATTAQAAAVTTQALANVAVAQVQIEFMLMGRDHLDQTTSAFPQTVRLAPHRLPTGQTWTLPELQYAIERSIESAHQAEKHAASAEAQVEQAATASKTAVAAPTPHAAQVAALSAQAAMARVLTRAAAAQAAVAEVLVWATRDSKTRTAIKRTQAFIEAQVKIINQKFGDAPPDPTASAVQEMHTAVAQAALAWAKAAVTQAQVAIAQARLLKLDPAQIKQALKTAQMQTQTVQQSVRLAESASGAAGQIATATAQAAAAAAVSWSQIAIAEVPVAALQRRDQTSAISQILITARQQLQEARTWAIAATTSATSVAAIAAKTTSTTDGITVPRRTIQRVLAGATRAQTEAQITIARAQIAMIQTQVAIAHWQSAKETKAVAENATALARTAAAQVQATVTSSAGPQGTTTVVGAVVTVGAAVIPVTLYDLLPPVPNRITSHRQDLGPATSIEPERLTESGATLTDPPGGTTLSPSN